MPIRVEHVVDGGPLRPGDPVGIRGVIVGHQMREGQLGIRRPVKNEKGEEVLDANGKRKWIDEPDKVQGIILLRKNEHSIPALRRRAGQDRRIE